MIRFADAGMSSGNKDWLLADTDNSAPKYAYTSIQPGSFSRNRRIATAVTMLLGLTLLFPLLHFFIISIIQHYYTKICN